MANYTLHALAPQITNTLALVPDTKAARGKLVTANTPPVPVPAVMIGKMALVNKKIGIILLVLLGRVVAALALSAGQGDLDSHSFGTSN